jgi:selT/selW/selH-like putative selenoprotein
LADYLEKRGFDRPLLVESSGGAFEVKAGGDLLFSKLRAGQFPEHSELVDLIKKALHE